MTNEITIKKEPGRPSIVTPEAVQKLESVFKLGVKDAVACTYARISERTFYDHLAKDDDFRRKIEDARNYARIAAGSVILDAISRRNLDAAKWWLERKHPDEFGANRPVTAIQINSMNEGLEIVVGDKPNE